MKSLQESTEHYSEDSGVLKWGADAIQFAALTQPIMVM
jgi:hypothetical protein